MPSNTPFLDQSESQRRQFIDAETVFLAAAKAKKAAAEVRGSMVWRKVDPSFEVSDDQLYTARNQDGFEVDIIRRAAKDADPHPLRMSDEEDDFWAVQVSMGEKLQSARRMDQVVVATSGEMALMRTIHPLDFTRIKEALSQQFGRDPNKRGKDALQSRIVTELVNAYLPHYALVDTGVA